MKNRRQFLTGVVSAGALAIAGCSSEEIDTEENEDGSNTEENEDGSNTEENEDESNLNEGPAEVVRNYLSALNRGDLEAVNSYQHPDSNIPEREHEQIIDSVEEGVEIQVVDAEVTKETEQSASVETEITLSAEGESQTNTGTFVLRPHDNEWKIYNDEESESDTQQEQSSASGYQLRVSYRGDWSGSISAGGSSRTVDGSGTETIDIDGDPNIISANAQKQDDSSSELTIQILEDGEVIEQGSTTASYGVAQITHSDY